MAEFVKLLEQVWLHQSFPYFALNCLGMLNVSTKSNQFCSTESLMLSLKTQEDPITSYIW